MCGYSSFSYSTVYSVSHHVHWLPFLCFPCSDWCHQKRLKLTLIISPFYICYPWRAGLFCWLHLMQELHFLAVCFAVLDIVAFFNLFSRLSLSCRLFASRDVTTFPFQIFFCIICVFSLLLTVFWPFSGSQQRCPALYMHYLQSPSFYFTFKHGTCMSALCLPISSCVTFWQI